MSPKFWKQMQNAADAWDPRIGADLVYSFAAVEPFMAAVTALLQDTRQVAVFILILILCYSLGTAWLELGAMRGCAAPLGFGLGHTMLEPRQQGSCHFWITVRTYNEHTITYLNKTQSCRKDVGLQNVHRLASCRLRCSGALCRRGMERRSVEGWSTRTSQDFQT